MGGRAAFLGRGPALVSMDSHPGGSRSCEKLKKECSAMHEILPNSTTAACRLSQGDPDRPLPREQESRMLVMKGAVMLWG